MFRNKLNDAVFTIFVVLAGITIGLTVAELITGICR
jgi:hypothetical protein